MNSIITSPPYFNLKDYGHKDQIGYHARTIDEYLADIEAIFKQCYRILRDDGALWLVSDCLKLNGELRPLPFMIAEALRRHGWILQDIVIWRKDKTLPFSFRGRFRSLFEYIYVFSKTKQFKFRAHRISERHKDESRLYRLQGSEARFLRGWPERYSPLGANPGDVWDIPIPIQGSWDPYRVNGNGKSHRIHYCPFPQELVARIIKVSTDPGDVILDPFAGSGAVAAQAELMRRRFVGVEINAGYQSAYYLTCRNFSQSWLRASEINRADEQDRLEEGELILKLRQVKHASVWSRLIDDALSANRSRTALVAIVTIGLTDRRRLLRELSMTEQPNPLAYPVNVYLLFSNIRNSKLLDELARKKLAEQGLKKYGLRIRHHIVDAGDITPSRLGLTPETLMSVYPVKRFFQCTDTINAKSLCRRIHEIAKTANIRRLQFVASDAHLALRKKTNVVEEVVKRFVTKFARSSIERLGCPEQAAEFLGMTRGELHRLLDLVPARDIVI